MSGPRPFLRLPPTLVSASTARLPPCRPRIIEIMSNLPVTESAMRMALAVTGKFDIISMIRGLHGGSLAVEALTSVGGNRKKGLGPLMFPAKANALLPPYCYRCPINLSYPSCDIACLKTSEEMLEYVTSQHAAGIMAETIPVPGGMIVPPKEWLPRLAQLAKRWGALLI